MSHKQPSPALGDPAPRDVPTITRRRLTQSAAWSVPVLVATAVPASVAASDARPPQGEECAVVAGTWSVPEGTTLYWDGRAGHPAGTNSSGNPVSDADWDFPMHTTGWTPIRPNSKNPEGHITVDWASFAPAGQVGFMSMDDRDNTDGANQALVQFEATFTLAAAANRIYDISFPVKYSAYQNGVQYFAVSVTGPNLSMPDVVKRSYGDKAGALLDTVPNEADFQVVGQFQEYSETIEIPQFVTTQAGMVVVTVRFLMPYKPTGNRQTSDIWIQAPGVTNCAA